MSETEYEITVIAKKEGSYFYIDAPSLSDDPLRLWELNPAIKEAKEAKEVPRPLVVGDRVVTGGYINSEASPSIIYEVIGVDKYQLWLRSLGGRTYCTAHRQFFKRVT